MAGLAGHVVFDVFPGRLGKLALDQWPEDGPLKHGNSGEGHG